MKKTLTRKIDLDLENSIFSHDLWVCGDEEFGYGLGTGKPSLTAYGRWWNKQDASVLSPYDGATSAYVQGSLGLAVRVVPETHEC
jgi:hypothetical protein